MLFIEYKWEMATEGFRIDAYLLKVDWRQWAYELQTINSKTRLKFRSVLVSMISISSEF